MKHYEYEINLFIDNELPAPGQKELFAHLAVCDECSVMLQKYIKIKSAAKDYFAAIDADEVNCSVSLPAPEIGWKNRTYKKHFYISSAAAVILLFLSIYQFYQPNSSISKFMGVKKELLVSGDSSKSQIQANNTRIDNIILKAGAKKDDFKEDNSSNSYNDNLKESEENRIEDIINKKDLFSMLAGQYSVQVIDTQNKGINKYFSGEFIDSPSVVRVIKLNGNKNGMTAFEKNIYEQLLSAPSNTTLQVDTVIKRANEYMGKFTGQNANYANNVKDLKYHNTPYIDKYGVYHPADSVITRDLFLREGDRHFVKPLKHTKTRKTRDIVKRESRYNDYLDNFKKEKVTQSDFLTPQILGN